MRWLFFVVLASCSSAEGDDAVDAGDSPPPPVPERPVAGDLVMTQVSLFQGVETVLWEGADVPSTEQAPVIADRAAMLRVQWERLPAFVDRTVVAQLSYLDPAGGEVVDEIPLFIDRDSDEKYLDDTFNFDVPAENLDDGFAPTVTFLEEAAEVAVTGATDQATWSPGALEVVHSDSIDLVIFPVRYDFDGSGRLPDTSAEQIQRIQEKFASTYPVTGFNVTVEAPLPVHYGLYASGLGWSELLDDLSNARSNANVRENTYYYALFNPEPTLAAYCGFGCVLGLAYLAPSVNDTWARVAIGTGYSGEATVDTMLQEVGHSHGREHAPCGVNDADPQYPYADASIGGLGYDTLYGVLLPPSTKDFMSYCGPVWLSDYTYNALFRRVQALAATPAAVGTRGLWRRVTIDAAGHPRLGAAVSLARPPSGETVAVPVFDANGASLGEVEGHRYGFTSLPGGGVWIPAIPGAVSVGAL